MAFSYVYHFPSYWLKPKQKKETCAW